MAKKPSVPKGTRDFSPQEVAKRNYIMETIKKSFKLYGFQPIETPSFENSETLMGKYGEEGDRLIFKILNSGDYLKDVREKIHNSGKISIHFFEIFQILSINPTENKDNYESILESFLEIYSRTFINEKEFLFLKKYFLDEKVKILDFHQNPNNQKKSDFLAFQRECFSEFYSNYLNNINVLNVNKLTNVISEKALRYDLTVPFARYVVQHQNEITFPFKRYQMQPVWRADRPQKGRFREFWQCDADVVGSSSLWQEIELVQLYDAVFANLSLKGIIIKINNRKILSGIAEVIGAEDKLIDFTVALDKLDKIGEEGVKKEMLEKGISQNAIQKLQPLFSFNGSNKEKLNSLSQLLATSQTGKKGIEEVQFVIESVQKLDLQVAQLELDVTLARGLDYYTGAIFEVSAPKGVQMGSIGGGGRYDDLTGIFGMKGVSGVGISFGLDRIYLVLEELSLFPKTVEENTKVLFINFGEAEALYAMQAISKLRGKGIASELYPDTAKMGKQMTYADKREIPFVVLAGGNEIQANTYTLKNMKSGEQETVDLENLIVMLKK